MMELKDLGKIPISDDSPSGKDVRYEPDFEALSQEIIKLSSPTASGGIDWEKVISLSSSILENQSKHLQVASYLCYALMKTENMEGLALGVHILKELIENFWDTMYPPKKRMKGRRGIVTWWEAKISDFISSADPVVWEKEKRDIFINDFNTIDEFLGEKMDDAPLLRPLINKIKSVVEEKPEEVQEKTEEPEKSLEPEKPERSDDDGKKSQEKEETKESDKNKVVKSSKIVKKTDSPVKSPKTAISAVIPSDSEMDSSMMLKQGLNLIGKSIAGLRHENPFDPLVYRFNRIVAWSSISDPPTATGGKTMLPPPDEHIIIAIKNLYDSNNWQELADSCESKVKQYLFWLDLSRYVAESMENMGHSSVSDVIGFETSLFIRLVPGIEKLSFSDGTAFADEDTKEWLRGISTSKASGTGDNASSQGDSIKQAISEQMGNAQKLMKEKKLDSALNLFITSISNSVSRRERFLWKLGLCRLLINAKQIKIAAPYINDILIIIDEMKLEVWEPDIAIDALSLVLTGLRLQKKDQNKDIIESVINRISMLDPVKAMELA